MHPRRRLIVGNYVVGLQKTRESVPKEELRLVGTADEVKPLVDFDWGVSPFRGDSDHFWREHLMGRVY